MTLACRSRPPLVLGSLNGEDCMSIRLLGRLVQVAAPLVMTSASPLGGQSVGAVVHEEQVSYLSGDIAIAATLFLPRSAERVPAIVFIHGAEGAPRHAPMYRENAAFFTSMGFAVLLWDKRGIGDTPGTFEEGRAFAESARDVIAGVEYLSRRPEIDPARIGVYGVSQGGWIGPLAATMSRTIAFLIANSGPGVAVAEANLEQRANEWIDDGFTPADTAEIKRFLRTTWRYYGTGSGYEDAVAARERVLGRPWLSRIGFPAETPPPEALRSERYEYYRQGMFDPADVLPRVEVPILAVFGAKDRHIPMRESALRFEAILRRSDHPDFTVRVFEDAGHGILHLPGDHVERLRAPTGAPHGDGPRGGHTYAPEFRPFLAEWLLQHVGQRTGS